MAAMVFVCLYIVSRFGGGGDDGSEGKDAPNPKRKLDREATLLFVQYPESEIREADPHRYRERPICQRCHRGGTATLLASPKKLCAGCHAGAHAAHRTDLVQDPEALRARLPLGPKGTVLCHTCHEHHDLYRRPGGLRMDREALCVACHDAR